MRRPGPHRSPQRAFTLIEMMVVILLIAIVSAMIIPEMSGTFEDALLRSTSRKLLDAFAVASSRAVTLNQDCRVRVNRHDGVIVVERRKVSGGREEYVPLPDGEGAENRLDPRITVEIRAAEEPADPGQPAAPPAETMTPDTIAFHSDGTAEAAEVRLQDRTGFQLKLRLNPVTARAWVIEPDEK